MEKKLAIILFFFMQTIAANAQSVSVKRELELINKTLEQPIPVRLLENVDSLRQRAQEIAIREPRLQETLFEKNFRKIIRSEVFAVEPLRPSDIPPQAKAVCADGGCYRVEVFNYVFNVVTIVVVNVHQKNVLNIQYYKNMQPEIPERLKKLAVDIAIESEEVRKELGYKPEDKEALMASTKTALNRSRCERSQHLCVAPTFVKGDKALWAIIDLTDLKLVGVRWTNVGNAGPMPTEIMTERKVQNHLLTECYCKTETHLKRKDWDFDYMLTSSDGMRISNVHYKGEKIIESAKLVDWHVSYSNTDGFGYSDGIGCPYFSSSAVVAAEPPKILPIMENNDSIGFVLQQNFYSEGWPRPCNYNYCQRFEFYNNGSFRITTASLGRGCGNDGTYRPVLRIAFAGQKQTVSEWKNNAWKNWDKEAWQLQNALTTYTPEGYQYKIEREQMQGYYIEPSVGQFGDGGRGDNAYFYVTKWHQAIDEGDSDLPTIGPCCNSNYEQGPEKFMTPADNIQNTSLVLWYVPQMKNDDTKGNEYCWAESMMKNGVYSSITYPCFVGPMFVPIQK